MYIKSLRLFFMALEAMEIILESKGKPSKVMIPYLFNLN